MAETKKAFHEMVAERLIEQLRAGTAPFQRPWAPGEGGLLPINPTTGKRYKGINALYLMSQGRADHRWMTYKQAAAVGAQVRKGEHGTPVQYWKFSEEQTQLDAQGRPVLDETGRPVKVTVKLERPRVFLAIVFNAEQLEGLPALARTEQTWDALARAEHLLKASGAVIHHGENNRAFYRPGTDSIHLPARGQFPCADNYYAVALHELGHWTGHASRLARDLAHPFGSEGYAREELRAEIASMILGDELGIGFDPGQHAAYVGSWIKALEEDPLEIFRAAAEAEKIKDYVMAFEQTQTQSAAQAPDAALLGAAEAVEPGPRTNDQAISQPISIQEGSMEIRANDATDGVAQAVEAEAWTLAHLWRGTLPRALETARLEQIEHSLAQLDAMQPLNTQNPFWTRHTLPDDVDALDANLAAAIEPLEQLREEARVAAARNAADWAAFDAAARDAFDVSLPHDWNGTVQVEASANVDFNGAKHVAAAAELGVEPQFWSVYAQRADGAYACVKDVETVRQAEQLAYRLAVVAANSAGSASEREALLARALEDRVRRDPASTDEERAAAKAARMLADTNAMLDEADRHARTGASEAPPRPTAEYPEPGARTYLEVPYRDKEAAKALGARWDRKEQAWYVPPGRELKSFAPWVPEQPRVTEDPALDQTAATNRVYLAVPYGERSAAKAAGAAWDKAAKSWYAGSKADMARLQRWLPESMAAQQAPAMTPRDEFADALRTIGGLVTGEHPIMDGRTHRIAVEGDRKGETAGFYVAHLDGHPAGYIKNNRTGVELTWRSKGYCLDPQEKATLAAEAVGKLAARAEEQAQQHAASAQRVSRQLAELVPVVEPTPYLRDKGIAVQAGVFTDKEGQTTYVPAFDVEGTQWTMQYIQQDGTKRFAKDSRKEGCFHPVGGMEALARAPALVISEGYATAATLAEVVGFTTVAAFDAGNLAAVARALHEKFPAKPVLILGDDDRQLEMTQGVNAGRVKAREAAQAVGGTVLFPVFAPGENAYPADLAPVTPQTYRAHLHAVKALEDAQRGSEWEQLTPQQRASLASALLSDAQLAALERMKAHTDFNDLATRSVLGREGLERQVKAEVRRVIGVTAERDEHLHSQQALEQPLIRDVPRRRAVKIA